MQKAYSLTEFGLSTHLSAQRRKDGSSYQHLSAGELQVIASQAYKALEKVFSIKSNRIKCDLEVSLT